MIITRSSASHLLLQPSSRIYWLSNHDLRACWRHRGLPSPEGGSLLWPETVSHQSSSAAIPAAGVIRSGAVVLSPAIFMHYWWEGYSGTLHRWTPRVWMMRYSHCPQHLSSGGQWKTPSPFKSYYFATCLKQMLHNHWAILILTGGMKCTAGFSKCNMGF